MKIGSLFAAAAVLATIGAASAQDLMDMGAGTEINGVAKLGSVQIPLPGGKWEIVMAGTDRMGSVKAGNVFLVQRAGEKIVGYFFVRTSLESERGYGWKRPNWCQRNNVHHNGSDNYYNESDADCWIVNHRVVSNRVSRLDILNQIKDWLRKQNATATMVGNRYWRNDSTDYLLVAHFVDPANHGFPPERGRSWVQSKWNAGSIRAGTPRQRFIAEIRSFGERYRKAIHNGFRSRLAGASIPSFAFGEQ